MITFRGTVFFPFVIVFLLLRVVRVNKHVRTPAKQFVFSYARQQIESRMNRKSTGNELPTYYMLYLLTVFYKLLQTFFNLLIHNAALSFPENFMSS